MEDENHQHVDLVDLSSNCVDLTTRKQIHNPSPSKKKTSSTYTRNLFVEDHGSKCTSHQSLLNQNGTSNLEFSSCKNSQGLSSESKRPAQTKTSIKSPQSLTGDFLSRSRSKIPRFLLNSSQYHSSLSESMCDDLEYLSLHQKPSSSFTNESFTSQRRSSNRKNTHQSERRQQRQQHSPNRSQYHEPISYVYSSVPRTPPSGSKHRRQLNGYRKNMANIDARLQELRNERANRPLPRSTRPRSGTNSTSGKHPTISQDSPSSSKNAHRPASHTEKPDTSRSNDSNYLQREFPNKCLSKDSLKCKNDSEDLSNPKGHDTPEDSAKYGSEDFSGAAVPQSAVVSPACQEVMLNLQGFRVADDTFLQDESWRNQSDSDSDVSDEDFVAIPPVDVEHDFDLPPIREENENAALFSHVQSSSDSAQTRQGGVFTVSSINQLADRNSSELPQRYYIFAFFLNFQHYRAVHIAQLFILVTYFDLKLRIEIFQVLFLFSCFYLVDTKNVNVTPNF